MNIKCISSGHSTKLLGERQSTVTLKLSSVARLHVLLAQFVSVPLQDENKRNLCTTFYKTARKPTHFNLLKTCIHICECMLENAPTN